MNERKNLPNTYTTEPEVPQTEPLRKAVQNARRRRRKKRNTLLASFLTVIAFAAIGFFAFFELGKHTAVTPKAEESETPQTDAETPVSGNAESTVQNEEMRGVWIASTININYPSEPGLSMAQLKAELDDIVKNTSEAGGTHKKRTITRSSYMDEEMRLPSGTLRSLRSWKACS